MKKTLLKELILPSFWLFFFIVSPKNDGKVQLKKEDEIGLKMNSDIFSASEDDKEKEVRFTKAVYLSGF